MANSQTDIENSKIFGLQYGGYSEPRAFAPYHLLLLGLDFVFNWIIDWAHTDPLAVLVIFVFQSLGLIVNLIVYIMASGSQAMQSGLRKSLIYHHQAHLINSLLYISLTASWYIWSLRKSWPSVSDQFSFSFGPEIIPTMSTSMSTSTTTPTPTTTTTTSFPTTTSFLNLSNLANATTEQSLSPNSTRFLRTFTQIKNLFPSTRNSMGNEMMAGENSTKEFYTLWSPGFVALYTIQRTVAIIYYFLSMKASFLVLNASVIDTLEETEEQMKNGNSRITKSPGIGDFGSDGGGRRISWDDKNQDKFQRGEINSIDLDMNLEGRMKRLRNFVKNSNSNSDADPNSVPESMEQKRATNIQSAVSSILDKNKEDGNKQ